MTALVAAVFSAGTCAAWLWLTPVAPASLAPSTTAVESPISYHRFDDMRTVALDFSSRPRTPVTSGLSGRITASSCAIGARIESGAPLASINGQTMIALATSLPLWRDLAEGDTGDDVKAIQTELSRLGFSTVIDGRVGGQTLAAVTRLLRRSGDASIPQAGIPAGRFVWIPSEAVTLSACDVSVGVSVPVGGTIATVSGGLSRASVSELPSDLVQGTRDLTVDSVTVPIDSEGNVSTPEALAALTATPSYVRHSANPSDSSSARSPDASDAAGAITGRISLHDPIEVGSVAPTAVYSIQGNSGCVSSARTSYPVTIVGSQLGQTFVHFRPGAKPEVARTPRKNAPRCS